MSAKKKSKPAPTMSASGVAYPKPVSARFDNTIVARMEACAERLSRIRKTKYKKSNVIEICVNSHLPVLEKEIQEGR